MLGKYFANWATDPASQLIFFNARLLRHPTVDILGNLFFPTEKANVLLLWIWNIQQRFLCWRFGPWCSSSQSDRGFLSMTGSFMSQFCMTQGTKMLDIHNHPRLTWVSSSQVSGQREFVKWTLVCLCKVDAGFIKNYYQKWKIEVKWEKLQRAGRHFWEGKQLLSFLCLRETEQWLTDFLVGLVSS